MHNNEILGRLADALTLNDDSLVEIFALGGEGMTAAAALARTRDIHSEGALACTTDQLSRFLDGFALPNLELIYDDLRFNDNEVLTTFEMPSL